MAAENDNPLEGLDDDQVAQIMHLQELTGEVDLLACRQRLERCQWNIEFAVNQSLFGGGNVYEELISSPSHPQRGIVEGTDDSDATIDTDTEDIREIIRGSGSSSSANGEFRAYAPLSERRPAPADSMPFLATTVRNQGDSDATPSRFVPPLVGSNSADSMPLPRRRTAANNDEDLRGAILRQINAMDRQREFIAENMASFGNRTGAGHGIFDASAIRSRSIGGPRDNIGDNHNASGGGGGTGNGLWRWVTDVFNYCYQWTLVVLTAVWRFIQTLALPGGGAGGAGYLQGGAGLGALLAGDGAATSAATVLAEVEAFILDFEAKYGRVHPTFYRGGFNQASRECMRQAKFLLVYLHAPNSNLTDRFCSQVLCNASVRDVINNAGNMLFWSCSIVPRNGEGYRTLRKLRTVSTFPSLCFLTPINQSMRLSAVIEGDTLLNVPQLIDKLYECVAANARALEEINAERNTHAANRAIRAEQDVQYLESLRADQEKEKEKQRQVAEKHAAALKIEQRHKARIARKQALEQRKKDALERLPAEPSAAVEHVRINLKFPSGIRFERRFSPDDEIQCVYYFALGQPETTVRFTVRTNFPRKAVPCSPDDPHISLKQADFKKAEALFVEMEEDDGSSSSSESSDDGHKTAANVSKKPDAVNSTDAVSKKHQTSNAVGQQVTASEGAARGRAESAGDSLRQRRAAEGASGAA